MPESEKGLRIMADVEYGTDEYFRVDGRIVGEYDALGNVYLFDDARTAETEAAVAALMGR